MTTRFFNSDSPQVGGKDHPKSTVLGLADSSPLPGSGVGDVVKGEDPMNVPLPPPPPPATPNTLYKVKLASGEEVAVPRQCLMTESDVSAPTRLLWKGTITFIF